MAPDTPRILLAEVAWITGRIGALCIELRVGVGVDITVTISVAVTIAVTAIGHVGVAEVDTSVVDTDLSRLAIVDSLAVVGIELAAAGASGNASEGHAKDRPSQHPRSFVSH
jgi:hypothetical protein